MTPDFSLCLAKMQECFFTEQLLYSKHCALQNMKRMMSTAANQEKKIKNEAIKPQFDSELLPEHIL